MSFWRVVIATPTMPFQPYETEQERQVQRLVDAASAHGAAVTLIAPRTQTAVERADYLYVRSRFLLRPVMPMADPKHREVITSWIEPPRPGPSRFLLEHPWFTELDHDRLPAEHADVRLSTAWALWSSAFLSLLAQLNYEVSIIHAVGWQTGLVPAMARCVTGWVPRSISVFSPGTNLPLDHLSPQVRAMLRLPHEPPSATTADSILAWGLAYAHAWDIAPEAQHDLSADPELAALLVKYQTECLLPRRPGDPIPEMLEHTAVARYAAILADMGVCVQPS